MSMCESFCDSVLKNLEDLKSDMEIVLSHESTIKQIPIQKTIVAVGIKKCTVSAPPDEKEDNSVKIQENLRTILITVGINLYVPYKSGTRGSVQAFDKIFNRLLDANRQGLCESKLLGTKYSRETQSLVTETEFVFKSGIGQSDLEYFEPIVTG